MSVGPQFPPERSVGAHGSLPGLTAAEARRVPQMPGRIDGCDRRVAPASQRRVTGLELNKAWTLSVARKIESSHADGGWERLCSAVSPQLSARLLGSP